MAMSGLSKDAPTTGSGGSEQQMYSFHSDINKTPALDLEAPVRLLVHCWLYSQPT